MIPLHRSVHPYLPLVFEQKQQEPQPTVFGKSYLADSVGSVVVEAKVPAAVADSMAETVAEALPIDCFVNGEMPTIDFAPTKEAAEERVLLVD